jgi:thioredoxin 1
MENVMASPHVTDITDSSFETEVLQSEVPVLIDFWATWCAPCKAISPLVDQLAEANQGKLKVVKVDVQQHRKTAMHFGVTNIPTLIVVNEGKEVGRQVGAGGGLRSLEKLVQPHLG